jgi:hypothetical protein
MKDTLQLVPKILLQTSILHYAIFIENDLAPWINWHNKTTVHDFHYSVNLHYRRAGKYF